LLVEVAGKIIPSFYGVSRRFLMFFYDLMPLLDKVVDAGFVILSSVERSVNLVPPGKSRGL